MTASIDNQGRNPFTRRRLARAAGRDFRAAQLQESSLRTYAIRASITSSVR